MYNISIAIKEKALKKIQNFIELAPGEISGLGTISKQYNHFIIEDVFLFKQQNTSASTTLDVEEITAMLVGKMQKNEDVSNIKLWWHSHANMGVFWSGTDDSTINNFDNKEYLISLVSNKEGQILCRFDLYHPIRLTIDDIKYTIIFDEENDLKEECKKEYDEKITTPKLEVVK